MHNQIMITPTENPEGEQQESISGNEDEGPEKSKLKNQKKNK